MPACVAEMQSVAFYAGEVCLGGALIRQRAPTFLDEARGVHRIGWSGGGGQGATFVSG